MDFVGLESNSDIISNSIFSASSNVISVGYCFISGGDKSKRSYRSDTVSFPEETNPNAHTCRMNIGKI